jgi:hypothetical protein
VTVNPELRRNLWLEATPVRLVLMPAILAGIFFLAYVSDHRTLGSTVASVALGCVALLACVWGPHLASESVLSELRGRTWDWQRTSGLGAWTLAWGKLAGSTAYAWYGAALSLAAYALAEPGPGARKAWTAALFVLGGVLAQAATTFGALHVASRGRVVTRAQSGAYLVFGVLFLYPLSVAAFSVREVEWYGRTFPTLDFAVASLAAFATFAIVGVWVRVRRELRVRTVPLAWPAFVAFVMTWAGGLADGGSRRRDVEPLLVAFGVAVLLTWATALVDRKDPVGLRRLARAARERRWGRLVDELPPWLHSLGFVIATSAVLTASPARAGEIGLHDGFGWIVVAVVLFLVRDLALLVHLNLGARPKRADLFALVLFLVGYVLVPLVLSATGWKPIAALFYPDPDRGPVSAAGAFVAAAVFIGFLAVRWREHERALGGGPGDAPAVRS